MVTVEEFREMLPEEQRAQFDTLSPDQQQAALDRTLAAQQQSAQNAYGPFPTEEFLKWNAAKIEEVQQKIDIINAKLKRYSKWQAIWPKGLVDNFSALSQKITEADKWAHRVTHDDQTKKTKKEQKTDEKVEEHEEKEIEKDMKDLLKKLKEIYGELDKIYKRINAGKHLVEVDLSAISVGGAALGTNVSLKDMFDTHLKIDDLNSALQSIFGSSISRDVKAPEIDAYFTALQPELERLTNFIKAKEKIVDALEKLQHNLGYYAGVKEHKSIEALKHIRDHFEKDMERVMGQAAPATGAPAAGNTANLDEWNAFNAIGKGIHDSTPAGLSHAQEIKEVIEKIELDLESIRDIEKDEEGMIMGLRELKTDLDSIKQKLENMYQTLKNYESNIVRAWEYYENNVLTGAGGTPSWGAATSKAHKQHLSFIKNRINDANSALGSLSGASSIRNTYSSLVADFRNVLTIENKFDEICKQDRATIERVINSLESAIDYLDRVHNT